MRRHTILVTESPQIDSALEIDPSSPVVGKEVTVKCVAAGVPEPTYQFKRVSFFFLFLFLWLFKLFT